MVHLKKLIQSKWHIMKMKPWTAWSSFNIWKAIFKKNYIEIGKKKKFLLGTFQLCRLASANKQYFILSLALLLSVGQFVCWSTQFLFFFFALVAHIEINLVYRFIIRISRWSIVLGTIGPFLIELWPLGLEKFQLICSFQLFFFTLVAQYTAMKFGIQI
jgi:hypothetical protein